MGLRLGLAIWGRLLGRVTGRRFRMLWLKVNRSTSAVATLAEVGVLKPYIDCVLPLTETTFAMKRFGAAQHRGKIVIGVAE